MARQRGVRILLHFTGLALITAPFHQVCSSEEGAEKLAALLLLTPSHAFENDSKNCEDATEEEKV
jgi:hypothetical protein